MTNSMNSFGSFQELKHMPLTLSEHTFGLAKVTYGISFIVYKRENFMKQAITTYSRVIASTVVIVRIVRITSQTFVILSCIDMVTEIAKNKLNIMISTKMVYCSLVNC